LNLRYRGTGCAIMTPLLTDGAMPLAAAASIDCALFASQFLRSYDREFGFTIPGRDILIDDVRHSETGEEKD
jgi:5-oxoprolinase (ATP-hydrolysing)